MRDRAIAILALAIPVLAGLGYLLAYAAPSSFVLVNAAALAIAVLLICFAPDKLPKITRRILIGIALTTLYLPLLTGPTLSGVERWLSLGPFTLHAGMLVLPVLMVLAGSEPDYAPGVLSVALLAALLQPDMATGAALTLAAFGLYDVTKDWRYGVFAAVAFTVSLVAAIHGELPAQPFVERVIFLLARTDPLAALGLAASLLASFMLMLSGFPGREASRKALAGCFFGFSFAGHVSNYPSALIGYGASPILGFGAALALLCASPDGRGSSPGTLRGSADFPADTGIT